MRIEARNKMVDTSDLTPEQKERLQKSHSSYIFGMIGHPKHLEKMSNSDDEEERWYSAAFGSEHYKDKLLHDPSPWIRSVIAMSGTREHKEALKNDPSIKVRKKLAKYGHKSLVQHFTNDKSKQVRDVANKRLQEPFEGENDT